jgi:V/A-type H+-transporting ATPase subunit C
MSAGARDAISAFTQSISMRSPDPQIIDIRLDRAMYAHMSRGAAALSSPFLEKLVRIYIDIANINAFLRIGKMRKDDEFLKNALIRGGDVRPDSLLRLYGGSLDGFAAAMGRTPYSALCADGARSFAASGRLAEFERCADNYVNSYMRKVKLMPFGKELVAAYYHAKQTEFKNVRIVMVGKINGMAQNTLRERLRDCYA